MAGGFKWSLDWDTNPLRKGGQVAADALQDTIETFEDLARQADRSTDKAGDGLAADVRDGGRTAERALSDLEDRFRDTAAQAQRSTKAAGDSLGDDFKRGARDAEEGTRQLKENAGSNFKELGASFDGTAQGMADGLQGFVAEATEGFGPAGLAAGAAFAIGIGVAQAKLQEIADKVNELKDQAAQLAVEWSEATDPERVAILAKRWDDLSTKIVDAKSWFELWQDDAVTAVEKIDKAASVAGPDVERFMSSFTESDAVARQKELGDVLDDVQQSSARLGDEIADLTVKQRASAEAARAGMTIDWTTADAERLETLRQQKNALDGFLPLVRDEYNLTAKSNALIETQARLRGQSVEQYEQEQAATKRAADAQQAYLDTLSEAAEPVGQYQALLEQKQDADRAAAEATAAATEDTSDSWEQYAHDVTVTMTDLIDKLNAQAKRRGEFEANCAAIAQAGGQAIADELRGQGPEAAGAVADLIAHATSDEQARYFASWSLATGKAAANGMATGITGQSAAVLAAAQGVVNGAAQGVSMPQLVYGANVAGLQEAVNQAARSIQMPNLEFVARVGRPQVV
jgi:hypothetical protein